MTDTWNIRERSETCSRCGRPFEAGATCHSRLIRGEERFERRDLCAACDEAPETGSPPVSRWRSVVAPPAPPAPEPIQRRSAEALLRRLADDPSREAANTRFILALMLERKRVLRCRDRFRDDDRARVFVYEHPQTGETFLVPDPGLTPRQAAQVREDLARFLQEEHPGDPPGIRNDPTEGRATGDAGSGAERTPPDSEEQRSVST